MPALSFGKYLRFALSGAVFFAAVALLADDAGREPRFARVYEVSNLGDATLLVGACLLVGTIVYALHRALLYVVVLRVLQLVLAVLCITKWRSVLLCPFRPTPFEHRLRRGLWRAAEKDPFTHKQVTGWGDQVHLLYCAAWAILLALYVVPKRAWRPHTDLRHDAWVLAVVLAAFGAVANLRLLYAIMDEVRTMRAEKSDTCWTRWPCRRPRK